MNALIAPGPRQPRCFLTAGWHDLVMLNFEIAPQRLTPFLSAGVELDFHEGRTFISLVGFRFVDTRVLGMCLPWHRCFDEVNLRFYVKRVVDGQTRRGVMFIKELAPRRLVSWVARTFYNENYVTVPVDHTIVPPAGEMPGSAEYRWKFAGRWRRLGARFTGAPAAPPPGSEAEFIIEHYWGYSRKKDGATMEYRVEHPPWRIWPAHEWVLECEPAALYGQPFAQALERHPSSALVAEGSPVVVRRGMQLDTAAAPCGQVETAWAR